MHEQVLLIIALAHHETAENYYVPSSESHRCELKYASSHISRLDRGRRDFLGVQGYRHTTHDSTTL